MYKAYTGINIQFPISQDILTGRKIIETRTYPLPEKYLNKEMVLIETPGKNGSFKARAVAIIKFTECITYKSEKDFYKDQDLHLVSKNSDWAWKDKPKFGWRLVLIKKFTTFYIINKKKGIKYTNDIQIPLDMS